PIEEFIVGCTRDNYDKRHIAPGDEREVSLLNSFVPYLCPKCSSGSIIKYGKTGVGLTRYKCKDCSGTFTVITGTIFDQRKISISQWLDFMVMIIGHGSFNLTSKINRNAFTTTKYWMDKLFLILEGWQESIMLEGKIYLDETYYPLMGKDTEKRPDGKGMRGLSRNKMCIGCAWDGKNLICIMEGFGKPSKKHTWESFSSHIKEGSKLIHDGENSHSLLVDKLNLSEEIHTTKETRGLKDKENPMDSINKQHAMLKKFLRAHSGFDRDDLQDYLNFFSFIASNPDQETLEKVKILLELVFYNPKILRYRNKNRD
ncbi:MAG: transposase, partial [Spirochaetales bacterium]|nr:transposase [Spirochaetales bacterium]